MTESSPPADSNPYSPPGDAKPHSQPGEAPPPSRGSLLVIFLTVFIDLLGFGMVLPLLPIYADTLGVDKHGVELGLLMASFSAMTFLFSPLWGRLSDRVGRRPVLMIGLLGSAVFYALFGLATVWQSLVWMFIARIGAGIAAATIPTAQAYIADSTPLAGRAKGMALIGAAFGLGFTFGPLLGYAALAYAKNQADVGTSPWPGYAAAILSAAAFLLAALLLPESLRRDKSNQGHAGHALFNARAWSTALSTPTIPAILLTSFVSVVSFGAYETTLSLLLKSDAFAFSFQNVLLYFAFVGFTLSIAQGVLVRRMAGRVSEYLMASAGAVVTILGFLLLAVASHAERLPLLVAASTVEVIGFSLMTPSIQSLISRRSDPASQGSILGVSQSVSALARVVGPVIAIPLFKQNATFPYWASAVMMSAGLVFFVLLARHGKDYGARHAVQLPE
jgi:DHA1 family tetracycline resistance protein-like MFS transporter